MQKVEQGGLPEEYQQVEWIKSDGNQYIDTGVIFNHGIKIETSMGWDNLVNLYALFGARADTGATRFFITLLSGNINFAYINDNIYGVATDKTIYDFIFDTSVNGKISYGIVGERINQENENNLNTQATGYIFAYHRASDNSVQGKSKAIYKSMVITNDSGNKLFEGIPCYRKADNEIGIYDVVSETFLTNLGSGTFTKGNDI